MSPPPETAYWQPSSVQAVPLSRGGDDNRPAADPQFPTARVGHGSGGPTLAVSHSANTDFQVGGNHGVRRPKQDPSDPSEEMEEESSVRRTKRRKLASFLERREVHWAVLSLIFVDMCLVIAALAAAVLDPEGGELEYLTYA
ncbi:MAG: hypothetical protein BJ554DRAFT_1502 [Olpidium bornovanus]|uniref:Uncharacterized protein n=1 Tax=Olpidium bornovanus TaxID=278681 RepID=A0A8H7ZRY2_9FUNG|nr:MAG: hypothetical protein BJ554DRAFT_1502 [Olpidium bornovanus]